MGMRMRQVRSMPEEMPAGHDRMQISMNRAAQNVDVQPSVASARNAACTPSKMSAAALHGLRLGRAARSARHVRVVGLRLGPGVFADLLHPGFERTGLPHLGGQLLDPRAAAVLGRRRRRRPPERGCVKRS